MSQLLEMAGTNATINNPLAIIMASAELIEKNVGQNIDSSNTLRLGVLAAKISKTVMHI